MNKSTVRAGSNIAFIKYWGVADEAINLPLNNSISMTLAGAHTTTTVEWLPAAILPCDEIQIDDVPLQGVATERLVRHLDRIRALAHSTQRARVVSLNNFPMASGIASSASGFAALTVAGCAAMGLALSPTQQSALARLGSGSACRSLFGGYVEWEQGTDHESSVAHAIFPAEHWPLVDLVAIVSRAAKGTSSERGHTYAATSPLNAGRIASVGGALGAVRSAIRARDLEALGPLIEQDALCMHAVMMTGTPSLIYWNPATVAILQAVREWREREGIRAYFTIDAGPNVHVICEAADGALLRERLEAMPSVESVLASAVGPAPQFLQSHLF